MIYENLTAITKGRKPLDTAVVFPIDYNSLNSVIESFNAGLIIPKLIGPKEKILDVAQHHNFDISNFQIFDEPSEVVASKIAVRLATEKKVKAIMKGLVHTNIFMHPIVISRELSLGKRLSHIFMAKIPCYEKPIFVTDAAINIFPDLNIKKEIIQNAIDLFFRLKKEKPKVALLSAVEVINDKLPATHDAAILCKMAERGQINGAILDGPFGFDLAISKAAAETKKIESKVAGDADILVAPSIESANILYKTLTRLFNIETAAIVVGAKIPIILTSRSDVSKKASAALALAYGRK